MANETAVRSNIESIREYTPDGMIVEECAADDMAAILDQVGSYTPPWLSGASS
jgi:hypothetical protein